MTAWLDPTREIMAAFRDLPLDRPVHMINLLRFRAHAAYPDDHADAGAGRTAGTGPATATATPATRPDTANAA